MKTNLKKSSGLCSEMGEKQNFDLFHAALKNYNVQCQKRNRAAAGGAEDCHHPKVEVRTGISTCVTCGEILKKNVLHEKEWRNYSDQKKDPTRVQLRKSDDRNIYKDVMGLGFSKRVINMANDLYLDVSKGNIYRGNCRRAIIFACVFHSYKSIGQPQTHEKLIKLFKLTRKSGLKGLKHVTLNSNSPILRGGHITAKHLIRDIMSGFSATQEQVSEVIALHEKIKNRSSNLNRARPNSIASGLIYFWIQRRKIAITLKEFAKKTSLSEITISKISREINGILHKAKKTAAK